MGYSEAKWVPLGGALQLEMQDTSLQSAEMCGTSNIRFGQSGQFHFVTRVFGKWKHVPTQGVHAVELSPEVAQCVSTTPEQSRPKHALNCWGYNSCGRICPA